MSKPFTPETLAEHLDVDRTMIYRAIKRGELRAWRLGGKLLRITREDAEAWLKSRSTRPEDMTSAGSATDGLSSGMRDSAAAVISSLSPPAPH